MKRLYSMCLIGMLLFLSGCELQTEIFQAAENGEELEIPGNLGEAGEISYTVPQSRPNVMVDQTGYRPDGKKVAVFVCGQKTENLHFRVVEAGTERIVFRGITEEKGMDETTGEYISYGTFTEISVAGTYYVEADGLGRSCPFEIGADVYSAVYRRIYQVLEEGAGADGVWGNCFVLTNLLMSYELYPEIEALELTDSAEEAEDGVPRIMSLGRSMMEKLCALQSSKDGSLGGDATKTAAFAGVAGQFARLYQEYDASFAGSCRSAAEKAWSYAQKEKAEPDESYYAAAQLFRLTGKPQYHTFIKEYQEREDESEKGTYDMEIYGDVTYLMTEKNVDVELCKELMESRMDEVETIAKQAHENLYQTVNGPDMEGADEMLQQMVRLAVIDYVITNHEYATVMENHLHFFLGCNPQGISILGGIGEYSADGRKQNILKSAEESAELFFMMSAVLSHEMDRQQEAQ